MKDNFPQLKQTSDLSHFLRTYASHRLKEGKGWNYSVWARALKLRSTSSITKVISGQRQPGPEMVEGLVRYFKFNPSEESHFRNLVLLGKNRKLPEVQKHILRTLEKNVQPLKDRLLDMYAFDLISEWHHLSVRELLRVPGLRRSPFQLAKLFRKPLAQEQVTRSFKILEALGLVKKTSKDTYKAIDSRVLTTTEIPSEAIKKYHESMLTQARDAVREVAVSRREYRGVTFLLDQSKLPEAKMIIQEFVQKMEDLTQTGRADSLYQFQVQLFPLTHDFPANMTVEPAQTGDL